MVGAGPNGLVAACVLAAAGRSVLVLEAADEPGGGTRSAELTLPGFVHDVCAAVHPTGALSPAFRALRLEEHGLRWASSPVSYAHPLDGRPAALAELDLDATAARLGPDGPAWRALLSPFLGSPEALYTDLLGPFPLPPRAPLQLARFGPRAVLSARMLADRWFGEEEARALIAGCAGHANQPLDHWLTAAFAMVFAISAHVVPWPVAVGGSQAIARALAAKLASLGGRIETGRRVTSAADLPLARAVLFDLAPRQVADLAGDLLPEGYKARLRRFHHGMGACKVDFALDGPIPWSDPEVARASTVHVGGTFEEIAASEAAVWRGEHPERPFLIVCQQSALDPSRVPEGKATGYAYCHVPAGSDRDETDRIVAQIERFAPGFRDRILATHTRTAAAFETYNPAYVGGAIVGGPSLPSQLFTRPVVRLDPYGMPNPRWFHCSQAAPPGGGVHGMCGWYAAASALRTALA